MLLTICMLAEPGVMVMAKSESEVQEAESVESEENTETGNAETETDKVDSTVAKEKQESETAGETERQPGERTATIMVVSITGNELTYYEVEDETETEDEAQSEGSMTPLDGMSQNDSDSTGMPENMPSGDFPKGGRSEQQDTKTVYLPVPVVVHTDTDEKRTFSILEAGDRLQVTIVTDEEGNETITEIWMLNE